MHALEQLTSLLAHCRAGTITSPHCRTGAITGLATTSSTPASGAPRFIDIGANLLDGMFYGNYRGKQCHEADVDAVLNRAADAGVERLIVTAGSLEESKHAISFIREQRRKQSPVGLYSTVGVHPTRALEFLPAQARGEIEDAMKQVAADAADALAATRLAELEASVLARPDVVEAVEAHSKALLEVVEEGRKEGIVVAVGECGLDYDRLFFCPAGVQKVGFEAQLTLAQRSGLPLFLHNRNTQGDFAAVCEARRDQTLGGGVVHSFDGEGDELEQLLRLGFGIGLNGCSLRTRSNLDVAARVPLGALHLETDAPWCSIKRTHAGYEHVRPLVPSSALASGGETYPEVKKEKWVAGATVKDRCEPCHIVHVLQVISGERKAEADEATIAAAAYENSLRMFWPGAAEAATAK